MQYWVIPGYASAKHGVLALTKVAFQEVARQNIRVNAICPGGVDTPMFQSLIEGNPELEAKLLADCPPDVLVGRMRSPKPLSGSVRMQLRSCPAQR